MIDRAAGACINEALVEGREMRAQRSMMRALLSGALALPVASLPLLAATVSPLAAFPVSMLVSALCLSGAAILGFTGSRRLAAAGLVMLAFGGLACLALQFPGASTALALAAAVFAGAALPVVAIGFRPMAEHPAAATVAPDDFGLVEHIAGLVLILDEHGGVTRAGGRSAAEFSRWIDFSRARGLIDRIHVSDRLAFMQALDRLRQGGEPEVLDFRLHRGTAASQFVHISGVMSARRDGEGGLLDIVAHARIVDAEVELRAECEKLSAVAEQAESEKTRFLAAVSHEMRTPLNAVIGFSEILSREYFAPLADERQREYVGLIRRSGEHLLSLVNTMLDMSKIESGRYRLTSEPFEIGAAVDDCVRMLGLEAEEKGLQLTARARRGGELVADRRAVQQILINLIGNAIKFTEPGGVITVDAVRHGSAMRLTVADTGIGMEPDVLRRLGEPFLQGDESYARRHQGTGLGLCLVNGLVALHGGRVVIESTPGKGTAVTVELPAEGLDGADRTAANGAQTVEFPPRLNVKEKMTVHAGEADETTAKSA